MINILMMNNFSAARTVFGDHMEVPLGLGLLEVAGYSRLIMNKVSRCRVCYIKADIMVSNHPLKTLFTSQYYITNQKIQNKIQDQS